MEINWNQKNELLSKVYSPTSPINTEDFFFGRRKHLDKIHQAIIEKGQHIIIYGERGVGKTSLANIVNERYRNAIVSDVTCNSSSRLHGIWKNLFSKITLGSQYKRTIGFDNTAVKTVESVIKLSESLDPGENHDADAISNILNNFQDCQTQMVFILDEFDQIKDSEVIKGISSIIKFCSDKVSNVTIIIVGIADSVIDLIGEHQSIERCIRQIYLEKMSNDELSQIIKNANKQLDVKMENMILPRILEFSIGFPHYTHLLGKYATSNAFRRRSLTVTIEDFDMAIYSAIENASESIRNLYQKGIITTKSESYFPDILLACALAPTDEHNTFRASDLKDILKKKLNIELNMQGYQYHIGKLSSDDRGNILKRVDVSGSQSRYRFRNPLFRAFILLKYYERQKKKV
jgi:Cdc6-like AAA superfamily ATPase